MKKFIAGAVIFIASWPAFAASNNVSGFGDLYLIKSKFAVDDNAGFNESTDGDGFGLRGGVTFLPNLGLGAHAKYERTSYKNDPDFFNFKDDEIRIGADWMSAMGFGADLEYVSLKSKDEFGKSEVKGYGVHGKYARQFTDEFGAWANLGYLWLKDKPSTPEGKYKGPELELGAHYSFTKLIAGVLTYRLTKLEDKFTPPDDIKLSEITLGGRFNFR